MKYLLPSYNQNTTVYYKYPSHILQLLSAMLRGFTICVEIIKRFTWNICNIVNTSETCLLLYHKIITFLILYPYICSLLCIILILFLWSFVTELKLLYIFIHSQGLIVQDGPLASLFGVSWSHTYRHKVGLLWTSDQPIAETSTYTGQQNI
jgi:hypothetical protein